MCSVNSAQYGIKTTFDLGDHAALDNAFINEILDIVLIENRDDVIRSVIELSQYTADICQSDEF